MNVYEAMRVVRNEFVPHTIDAHLAMDEIGEAVDAYDALAPDWANAPDWAQWYAIDADGAGAWYEAAPNVILSSGVWNAPGHELYVPVSDLFPEGIDWRLCKWSRPEVTK